MADIVDFTNAAKEATKIISQRLGETVAPAGERQAGIKAFIDGSDQEKLKAYLTEAKATATALTAAPKDVDKAITLAAQIDAATHRSALDNKTRYTAALSGLSDKMAAASPQGAAVQAAAVATHLLAFKDRKDAAVLSADKDKDLIDKLGKLKDQSKALADIITKEGTEKYSNPTEKTNPTISTIEAAFADAISEAGKAKPGLPKGRPDYKKWLEDAKEDFSNHAKTSQEKFKEKKMSGITSDVAAQAIAAMQSDPTYVADFNNPQGKGTSKQASRTLRA